MKKTPILAPLKYRDYTWPHNPKTYGINFEKRLVIHSYPYTNYNEIDDLGVKPREVQGEGEFVGPDAYDEFQRLASIFYKKGPGKLVHPIWEIQDAVFQSLKVEQEPTPEYIRYSFSFIEHFDKEDTVVKEVTNKKNESNKTPTKTKKTNKNNKNYTVKKGDNLSFIAKRNNMKLRDLIKKNPQIKNPNLIYPGQKINL